MIENSYFIFVYILTPLYLIFQIVIKKYNFFDIANTIFLIVISFGALSIEKENFSNTDMRDYFLSVIIIHFLFLSFSLLQTFFIKNKIIFLKEEIFKRDNIKIVSIVSFILVGVLILIVYVGLGGTLPIIEVFNLNVNPLKFRVILWREIFPSLPLNSLYIPIAKIFPAFLSFYYYFILKNNKLGTLFLVLAIIANTIELAKSGLVLIFIPFFIYMFFYSKNKRHKQVIVILALLVFGLTLFMFSMASMSKNGLNLDIWILLELLRYRIFDIPTIVSMIPYSLFDNSNLLYGATIRPFAYLYGGYEHILGGNYSNIDNYFYRKFFNDMGDKGGANCSYFAYSYADFGLTGVIVYTLFIIGILYILQNINFGKYEYLIKSFSILFLIKLITSTSFEQIIFTIEGFFGLFLFYILVNRYKASFYIYLVLILGVLYNLLTPLTKGFVI